jgi:hypothetical protein
MIDIRISEEFGSKPKFHNRIDRSDLLRMYISKPLEASNAFLDNPILKLLGWNLPILRTASYSSRSQKRSHSKVDRLCISEKLSRARSGPQNNPHNFLLGVIHFRKIFLWNNTIGIKYNKVIPLLFSCHNS